MRYVVYYRGIIGTKWYWISIHQTKGSSTSAMYAYAVDFGGKYQIRQIGV